MNFWLEWGTVLLVGCFAVIIPGPNFAVTVRNSLFSSRTAGVYTALGLALGNCVHATYCLLGIAVVLTQSLLLFSVVKYIGAAYLFYLGIQGLRARKMMEDRAPTPSTLRPLSAGQAVRSGFLTNLLNPKVTLFFLALFTQIIRPGTPSVQQGIFGLTIVGLEFLWFSLVALVLSAPPIHRQFMRAAHWLERLTGAVLIGLSLRLAFAENH